jgi:hypothetical protein
MHSSQEEAAIRMILHVSHADMYFKMFFQIKENTITTLRPCVLKLDSRDCLYHNKKKHSRHQTSTINPM